MRVKTSIDGQSSAMIAEQHPLSMSILLQLVPDAIITLVYFPSPCKSTSISLYYA